MLQIGSQAPDFTLPNEHGEDTSLSGLLQTGPLILYFYPADFTPGCTREACSIRDMHAGILTVGLQVAGISPQDVESHVRFKKEYELPFMLLSDPGKTVIRLYGVDGPFGVGVRRGDLPRQPGPNDSGGIEGGFHDPAPRGLHTKGHRSPSPYGRCKRALISRRSGSAVPCADAARADAPTDTRPATCRGRTGRR